MAPVDQPLGLAPRALDIVRRPLVGTFLFGLILGGFPIGVALATWFTPIMTSSPSNAIIAMFLFFSISVATVGAVLGGSNSWKLLLYTALVVSLAMCIPIPLVVDFTLLSVTGYQVLDVHNFPFHVILCFIWSVEVTIASGALAVSYALYQRWRSQSISTP
jgi:hypothetical protein